MVVMAVGLLTQIGCGIIVILNNEKFVNDSLSEVRYSMKNANFSNDNDKKRILVDYIQTKLECCGTSDYHYEYMDGTKPLSCCKGPRKGPLEVSSNRSIEDSKCE